MMGQERTMSKVYKCAHSVLLICSIWLIAGCGRADVTPTPVPAEPASGAIDTTYVVQRGSVVKTIELNGRVVSMDEMSLHFKAVGYVKEVHVKQGDLVQVGDLLAELETDDLLNQIAQAEVNLDSAKRLLSKAEDALKHQIALAELDLSIAKATASQAQEANVHAIKQAELALQLAKEERSRTLALQATIDQDP